ncbi:hypothetical protein [Leptolyngbya sp. GGD]|uniref:hypothetical protein n=1 Tax=Leptolyngbya sp. GGD TaxID=2997907 RepID=UPI00227D37C2|nr:hypothetical protein [Leptolyngbya sp. GGD]MCY6494255.1 hypothetical protein [Leptolyngbya sp. GGD]
MKLKQLVIVAATALLGWFGISHGIKLAQAYTSQQQALGRVASLLSEVGDPNQAPNLETLKHSQKKLQGTISVLEAIPNFPGFEAERAKADLGKLRPLFDAVNGRIQREEQALADLNAALNYDTEAAEMVKDSPHPAEVWQQARDRWQQSINLLEKIPPNSFVAVQAKAGLEACRTNFKIADTQWISEFQALKNIDSVLALVEQAKKSIQTRPYQLTELQDARKQWQQSLEQLNKVKDTTTAYSDAQLLVDSHQANILKLDSAIAQIRNCQNRYQLSGIDSTSTSLCGYDVSLDLDDPKEILIAQAEPQVGEVEMVDDDRDITITSVSNTSTGYYSRYRQRISSRINSETSGTGGTWVRGYTRSNGTHARGHSRGGSSTRVSGFGASRSGGASS